MPPQTFTCNGGAPSLVGTDVKANPSLDESAVRDQLHNTATKLSYRKDDRAMRPMYGCPENFRESLTTPTATFLEIFNGLLF